jgi:hypothetical protein
MEYNDWILDIQGCKLWRLTADPPLRKIYNPSKEGIKCIGRIHFVWIPIFGIHHDLIKHKR